MDGQALEGLVRPVPRERAAQVLQADLFLEDADRRVRQRQERLHGLHEVAAGLDAAEGLGASLRDALGGARRSAGALLWRRRWLKGFALLTPPVGAFLVVYVAAVAALFVSAFWSVNA